VGADFVVGNSGANAESIISMAGSGNQYLKEDTVQMADGAQVIGGDKVEVGATLTNIDAGRDYLGGAAVKVGDNSSYFLTSMDANTQSILDQALTTVAANANNFLSLAAGRNPDAPLADESIERSVEITSKAQLNPWAVVFVLLTFGLILFFRKRGG
jgi:hypothetical protein